MIKENIESTSYINSIKPERIQTAKSAYTTRLVDKTTIATLLTGDWTPSPGDLVLARVERIGHHKRIELAHGRRAHLFIGDEIIVSYGHRYAPDQFESEVPNDLSPCHLVAGGGIASNCLARHSKTRVPTRIQPIGLLGDANGKPINMADWTIPNFNLKRPRPFVITVVGTSMNAGKTTTAARLIKGLSQSGMKVGAAKLTGTGAGCDRWLMIDSGAQEVVDFTDAGFASTYLATLPELEKIQAHLMGHLHSKGAEVIVLEVADGLFQQETAMLLESPKFKSNVDAIIFAAGDAMGAHGGAEWLRHKNLPIVAIAGCVTSSPLAAREAQKVSKLPVLNLEELSSPEIAVQMFELCDDLIKQASKVS